jgi:hypothetical protein
MAYWLSAGVGLTLGPGLAVDSGLAPGVGLTPGAGLKLAAGVGPVSMTGLALGIRPAVSGVSTTPYVSFIGCLLRNLLRVQRSTVIPAIRIFDNPECLSSSVTCTIIPGVR